MKNFEYFEIHILEAMRDCMCYEYVLYFVYLTVCKIPATYKEYVNNVNISFK
jgi:hypothetical protein